MIAKPPLASRGFSLVELLVVIGMIGLLASMVALATRAGGEVVTVPD